MATICRINTSQRLKALQNQFYSQIVSFYDDSFTCNMNSSSRNRNPDALTGFQIIRKCSGLVNPFPGNKFGTVICVQMYRSVHMSLLNFMLRIAYFIAFKFCSVIPGWPLKPGIRSRKKAADMCRFVMNTVIYL